MNTTNRNVARAVAVPAPSVLSTNRVLRNTYLLLSLTLLFSAAMAGVAMMFNMPYLGLLPTLLGYFGLLAGGSTATHDDFLVGLAQNVLDVLDQCFPETIL